MEQRVRRLAPKLPTEEVRDIRLRPGMTVEELLKQFRLCGGFVARELAVGREILEEMLGDGECLRFLSFPACVVATGLRGVLRDLIRHRLFDVVITTCGTLDHDLARVWRSYYHGSFYADDVELVERGVHRLGNVFIPKESYGLVLEEKMQKILSDIYREKRELSTKELVWEVGKRIEGEDRAEESIVYWCYKNQIPMFIPGITDGAVGSQLWLFWQTHRDFSINLFRDEQELCDLVFSAKRSGALVVGGGISKHHLLWWNQFREGLDYAVYVTTAVEYDGSLSGARPREAISWGKLRARARYVTIDGDATLILPLLVAGLYSE